MLKAASAFLKVLCCGLAVLFLAFCQKETPAKAKKEIDKVLLISVDDLRADFLGSYNSQMKTSPNLDQLARESVFCSNVTSQASTTAPSHKSIFYSLYPSIHKTSMRTVPEEKLKSPMEILQSKGFRTAGFTGGGQVGRSFGFARGFNTYWEPTGKRKFRVHELERKAVDWLRQNHQQKFFLFLHTFEVHCPLNPPKKFLDHYAGWYTGGLKAGKCGHDYYNRMKMTPENIRYVRDLYAAEVNYVDTSFGRLFDVMKELGIYDKTLIVFMSDHGESLGERGYFGHNQLYNVQLQIPLMMRIPGESPARIDQPVEAVDVMPTIFAALGLGRPFPFQGKNLLSVARNQAAIQADRPLISEQIEQYRVRKLNFAAIFSRERVLKDELYDLNSDPEEKNNLAASKPETLRQMRVPYERNVVQARNISSQFVLGKSNKPQLDPEQIEQLKALGYVME